MTTSGLTERFCASLFAIPQAELAGDGARLFEAVWSRFPGAVESNATASVEAAAPVPAATDRSGSQHRAETAAFNNAFQFARAQYTDGLREKDISRQIVGVSIPVFSATAFAEARGNTYGELCAAIGWGMEAYQRLFRSLAATAARKGFSTHVVAGLLSGIVACGAMARLRSEQVARAIGLGCSAITAMARGYLPIQAAMATRDGTVMVTLVSCGFGAPPDVLACRWGIYETFAAAADIAALDLSTHRTTDIDALLRLFPDALQNRMGPNVRQESSMVSAVLAEMLH